MSRFGHDNEYIRPIKYTRRGTTDFPSRVKDDTDLSYDREDKHKMNVQGSSGDVMDSREMGSMMEMDKGEPMKNVQVVSDTENDERNKVRNKLFKGLAFGITEDPPWYICFFLGAQQLFAMFGTSVTNILLLAPSLCLLNDVTAMSQIIATTFFCAGIATLLQSFLGVRLPIVQGSSFTYITPIITIMTSSKEKCDYFNMTDNQSENISSQYSINPTTESTLLTPSWQNRISEIQGAIMVASVVSILIGFSGILGFVLQYIGPLTLTTTMTLIGLQLFDLASGLASQQWWIALVTVILIAMFSQFTRNIILPACQYKKGQGCTRVTLPIFQLFPIVLSVCISWAIVFVLELTGVIKPAQAIACKNVKNFCTHALDDTPWFRVPYPFQYGWPTFTLSTFAGVLAGLLASIVESIGDYYACARISLMPPPPLHAINRGIGMEGIGTLIFGMFGCPTGSVSYTENIGTIGTTKVASRRVIHVTAIIMLVFGVMTKFGTVFVIIPDPIKGGLLIVVFGIVTGIGLSNLQFVDMDSSRNLFILGFSLFFGITLPKSIENGQVPIHTGKPEIDEIIRMLLSTGMLVGGISAMVLDNTVPGSMKERGIISWKKHNKGRPGYKELIEDVYTIKLINRYLKDSEWARYVPFLSHFDEKLLRIYKRKPRRKKSSDSRDDLSVPINDE